MDDPKKKADASSEADLDAFLDRIVDGARAETGLSAGLGVSAGPQHRQLRVAISADRLEAHLEAVFPDTTLAEVRDTLRQERIIWGILEADVKAALERADRTGRRVLNALVAQGLPAVYRKRKEVDYLFLHGLKNPETGEVVHLASSVFRDIAEVMSRSSIDRIRGYGHPVLAVAVGEAVMRVQGEDEIEPGRDVFGREIRTIQEEGLGALKAGDGLEVLPGGSLCAARFGYVSTVDGYLTVISPIWITPDRMEAYFVNPPQLGAWKTPDTEEVVRQLTEQGVCFGIDREIIDQMCRDLRRGTLRESCVRIARGRPPNLLKGQITFSFDPIPPARFEAVQEALRAFELQHVTACETEVSAVHAETVLAEQHDEGNDGGAGTNLFGEPVAAPEDAQEQKAYKAGANVRREVREGRVYYISEIYGYAGVIDNRIVVLSPIWISPDRMLACSVSLPQTPKPVYPTVQEVEALLEWARIRHGVDREAIRTVCEGPSAGEASRERAVPIARGTPSQPGQDGTVELLFKQMPDPGEMLVGGKIDFRERDAVPNVQKGQLLARRTLPTPGTPGIDVRGRMLKPSKSQRELLYTGPNVASREEDGKVCYYATAAGCPRVGKDTLSVAQLLRHRGDVDYAIGNIRFDGSVEIEGTVKSWFRIEATGDVYVGGTVDQHARVTAGGNVIVQGGIIGARVNAGEGLYAKFIQDSRIDVAEDLVVRSYIQDSQVQVGKHATIQGDEGGRQHLCLLGGTLHAVSGIQAASIGSMQGRQTQVIVGVDTRLNARLVRYRRGLEYSEVRSRRLMRALQRASGGIVQQDALAEKIREASTERREFLVGLLGEMRQLGQLKASLEHHIRELKEQYTQTAARAHVRVTGTAFPKVTVQIGELYRVLDEEIRMVCFQLTQDGDRVSCAPL